MIGAKFIAVLMIIIVLLSLFFFIPTGESQTIDAPFGNWFVEVEGITTEGETIQFSLVNTIGKDALSFTYGGKEVDQINCYIYAQATGEGYEYCDIDLSQTYVSSNLMVGNTGYEGETIYGPSETVTIDVNGDKELVMTTTLNLDHFEDIADLDEGPATLEIYCFKLPIRYRGRNGNEADPWVEEMSSFFVHTGINFQYEEEEPPTPTCGEKYPGNNCFTNPSVCGACSSTLSEVTGLKGDGISEFLWGSRHIRYKYHTSDGWTSWDLAEPGNKIQVFYHHNVFGLYGKASGSGTFRAYCFMISPSGEWVELNKYAPSSWNSNLDKHVEANEECFAYFSTGWESNHLLTENGQWRIQAMIWVELDENPNPNPNYYDLTVRGEPSAKTEYVELDGVKYDGSYHTFENVEEGSHVAKAYFHLRPERVISKSIYLSSDTTVIISCPEEYLQMITLTMFSIEIGDNDYQRYEYNGNYLGD